MKIAKKRSKFNLYFVSFSYFIFHYSLCPPFYGEITCQPPFPSHHTSQQTKFKWILLTDMILNIKILSPHMPPCSPFFTSLPVVTSFSPFLFFLNPGIFDVYVWRLISRDTEIHLGVDLSQHMILLSDSLPESSLLSTSSMQPLHCMRQHTQSWQSS